MIVSDSEFADSERLILDKPLVEALKRRRAEVLTALAEPGNPVYGVTTGMGRLAGVVLDPRQQAEHQRNLLIGRAVGGPPWLPPEDVRALLVVRLRDFLRPWSGVSPELVQFLVDRLNDGFTPAVPRFGLGSSGEIIALSHAFQTFLGLGTVLEDGVEVPAAAALAARGAAPYVLGPKEGASLLQGSPLAVMHAARGWTEAQQLVDLQTLTAAMAIDVLGAPRAVFSPVLAGGDDHLRAVLHELTELVGIGPVRPGVVQAPLSVRVAPRALAHASRVNGDLHETRRRWETMPGDSPSFVDGSFVPGTGYHAVDLGLRMDAVTAALVHLGEISVQRTHRLLDERFSGLPPQLTADPGPRAGLVPLHKRAAGELHALRRLATPATLGSIDTSAGQEDVQAFASAAGEQLRAAASHLFAITACELITASQARYLAGGEGVPGLRAGYGWVRSVVPPLDEDRSLGPEVERLVAVCRAAFFDDLATLT
ncbi:histidine ammonia-lyase [Amycolatopsis mediterranei S699]|uniref:Histidine ammonia-lyase n=2 Tax=Amycolatopsis mediterranei TaxID=33910 RepID=A0A0H3CVF5_AMYMU|nr:aromatic amino acid lyase [Amycolatopsis mediterranei]ADJ42253.1 histidine ammonia-lyase [Amycolatopsis mediterranei U32]AEK38935.1 histidine ammonia-lyase [Amycolatopsis mediterranei S699]AFO73967.1 histidine ammonia-lyase [Amycolatopsis mediterranei S699]AGT81096.1 histidine ammonia-lyase [Amycolatopsis mediterranei RB]KDO06115.1 histidine ammonia-lyase [Amycolatopsis mediterranei]